MFAVFSFVNSSAMDKNVIDGLNYDKENNDKFNTTTFTIDQFAQLYETIKQNENFNNKFFLEANAIGKGTWTYEEFGEKPKIIYDANGQVEEIMYPKEPAQRVALKFKEDASGVDTSEREIDRECFLDSIIENYFSFKQPKKFKGNVSKLESNKLYYLIFKNSDISNVNNLTFNNDCITTIVKDLKELPDEYKNYRFKINDSGVTCLSVDEKGRYLEQLINYCIFALKFGELITEKPDLVTEWYEFRKSNFSQSDSEV